MSMVHPEHAALRSGAATLAREFEGTFNPETITKFLESSYDELVATATTLTYLPLLAERFARDRLQALARTEGLHVDGKPVVLFLCVHNAGRSQMALGFFTHYTGDTAIAWSGGSEPGASINANVADVMAEKGIDISGEFPKPWTDEVVRAADVVITMGCGDVCPIFPGKRYEEWALPDPEGLDLEGVRHVRDDIDRRVRNLMDELGLRASD